MSFSVRPVPGVAVGLLRRVWMNQPIVNSVNITRDTPRLACDRDAVNGKAPISDGSRAWRFRHRHPRNLKRSHFVGPGHRAFRHAGSKGKRFVSHRFIRLFGAGFCT
ncbi:hypothetical protein, partial [Nocardia tengchongensis]|uniref:hypothetical protein n=1 Tax=Nocardia tengchongensis TaxID=2055889 RepID=UPI00369A3394